jgi:hypothetical protein
MIYTNKLKRKTLERESEGGILTHNKIQVNISLTFIQSKYIQ